MQRFSPSTVEELAESLRSARAAGNSILLEGAGTKRAWGGTVTDAHTHVATSGLRRLIHYEPKDLTISVEAGMPFRDLQALLAANRQTIPLDPPYHASCTVGGTLAANASGPIRRLYGTARDMVIGMTFVTLDGQQAKSGGMVVKNVAGLDLQKAMIGSYGTLAAIASVNFKVASLPEATKTFVQSFDNAMDAAQARDRILNGVLLPTVVDVLNPAAASQCGLAGFCLVVQAAGSAKVLSRYERELSGSEVHDGEREQRLFNELIEFTPSFLARHDEGAVVKVVHRMQDLAQLLDASDCAVVARAGNGVTMLHFSEATRAVSEAKRLAATGWPSIVEATSSVSKATMDLWPAPGDDLLMMTQLKEMFDPKGLLNRGRLHGRI